MINLLKEQNNVKNFVRRNKLEMKPEFAALDLVSEVGELTKEILSGTNYGRKKFTRGKNLQSEFGDAFYSLINLSNSLNINLEKSLRVSLKKYEIRMKKKGTTGSC